MAEAGYLIAEEGPLSGKVLRFDEGNEWVLGRDPDASQFVLEDPMVSRRHVICRLTPEGFVLENLSSVNPATQNGKIITEPVLLHEGDIIQIGSTFFRFTEKVPRAEGEEETTPTTFSADSSELASLRFAAPAETRWLLKVITGPNSGAEFNMQKGDSYTLGKDPSVCDIVFQDLSVSREHARITLDDQENVFIEDLGSRNGTVVNGVLVTEKKQLASQDLVAIGTTSFLVIDRSLVTSTIVSPPILKQEEPMPEAAAEAIQRDWREIVIPKRHFVLVGIIGLILIVSLGGMLSLFKSEPVTMHEKHEGDRVAEALKPYTDVQFSYNEGAGKLFLMGHVLTAIDKQELMYVLKGLPFIRDIDDNVVIDEYVWQNMNALLVTNPDWQGITIHSPAPGRFVVRGYLQTSDQALALSDYLNVNFPYLDRLDNQVVVENNLNTQIASELLEKGFNNVTYQLTDGDLVLSGRVDGKESSDFNSLIQKFKGIMGIRSLKNYVIYTTEESSLVDLTTKYKVMGFSKKDGENSYIVINGKILSVGDMLDGMKISAIMADMVLLEKDGLKFKINYNLQ